MYFKLELIRNIETAHCTCDFIEITMPDTFKLLWTFRKSIDLSVKIAMTFQGTVL